MRVPPLTVVAHCPVCGLPVAFDVEIGAKAIRSVVEAHGDRPRQAYLSASLRAVAVEHDCPGASAQSLAPDTVREWNGGSGECY